MTGKKFLKAIIGIALLPVCLAETIAFYHILKSFTAPGLAQISFVSGVIAYAICFSFSWKMILPYVFGHEAVHAIIAFFCGAKIASFRVSSRGGSVATSKTNFMISLAPYFLPLYTVLIALGFFILKRFLPRLADYGNLFLFLSGFTLSFHFFMTIHSLRTEQTDLTRNGYLFSLSLIYLVNLFILAGVVCAIFAPGAFGGFLRDIYLQTKSILMFIFKAVAWLGHLARKTG